FDRVASLKDHWAKYRSGQGSFLDIIKSGVRLFTSTRFSKMYGKEKGYVYFQDFISGNDSDFRIIVIRSQFAYGMRRMNRKNDFRASGSSDFVYDNIPEDM